MRKNKTPFFIIFILLFSSCYTTKEVKKIRSKQITKYLLVNFNSNDLANNFGFQNENLKLQYTVSPEYNILIENISKRPVYLDVGRSSLIVNKISYNYLKTLDNNERFYYLPNNSQFVMVDFKEKLGDLLLIIKNNLENLDKKDTVFNLYNSPLTIRSHLTYSQTSNFESTEIIDNQIFVESLKTISESEFQTKNFSVGVKTFLFKYYEEVKEEYIDMEYVANLKVIIILASFVGLGFIISFFL